MLRVSEERLATVLGRGDHSEGLLESNPVAALIVESLAASHPRHSAEMKEAGTFLLDLLRANEPDATRLNLAVAMQVLTTEEAMPAAAMRARLDEIAGTDLLLSMSVNSLLTRFGKPRLGKRKAPDEVVRMLYLLMRMFEVQEEADVLNRALEGGAT